MLVDMDIFISIFYENFKKSSVYKQGVGVQPHGFPR